VKGADVRRANVKGACPCEGGRLLDAVRADVDRYVATAERDGEPRQVALPRVALSLKVWAVVTYRITHFALTGVRPEALGRLLAVLSTIGQRFFAALTGIEIDAHAHVGPGLMIPHDGYVVIGPVRVGRHCTISQGVTLGQGLRGTAASVEEDTPVLGDRVWVGPGAVIASKVSVGSDASIGANSVVLRDVPARGVVLGVPARLVSRRGSFAQVYYRDMDADADRACALAARGAEEGQVAPS
jgi:serine O-acetyltransferase